MTDTKDGSPDENSSVTKTADVAAAEQSPSRRELFPSLAAGAVAVGSLPLFAGTAQAQKAKAQKVAASIPSIQIPKEIPQSLTDPPKTYSFEGRGMTGAEVFAQLCKKENLAAMFCAPGNYTVIHAVAAAGIPSYGGRTEGSMCAAADGFSRATGEVVACSGTEGPGFTNMIAAISAAHCARTPLLVLASNAQISGDDREKFIQQIYQQPLTEGIKKYGKRMIAPNRVHEYGAYAFRHLKSGIPGPVHLDFPGEVARQRFTDPSALTDYYDKTRYRTESVAVPGAKDIDKAIDMINRAQRPILVAGHGVFHRKGWDALMQAAEKHDLVVATSGPMKGHFPDDHRLSANLSPDALLSADLVIFVGQYCMPSPGEYRFNPDIKSIRVHPVAEDIGRNWPIDLGIVGDEGVFLDELANKLPRKTRDSWVSEIAAARKKYQDELDDTYRKGLKYSADTGFLHPAVICREIHEFFFAGKGGIDPKQTLHGWGGNTMPGYIGPMCRSNRPAQGIIPPYQFGTIGQDLSMVLGATVAVKEGVGPQSAYKGAPSVCLTSDAGLGYSLFEVETAAKYKIPLIGIVYNNNAWGTFTSAQASPRSVHLHLFQENLRYDKAAEGLGCRGEYVRTAEEFRAALKRSYDIAAKESLPSLINVQAIKEFSDAAKYPPGALWGGAEPSAAGGMH
ncbi:MAG TPA: thiamine pyrophosphate-binding protein [Hyphomonadaceae bacterium]|nr:thiamine pyrophosphate-binding protein [Hyphomonadaceae bacterium]